MKKYEFLIFVAFAMLSWSYFATKERREQKRIYQLYKLKPNGSIYQHH